MIFKIQLIKTRFLIYAPFLLVLFGNLWIWRILTTNILIGLAVVFSSYLLYKSVRSQKLEKFLLFFFLILLIFQYTKTRVSPLTYLNEQEKVLQLQRLNEHPPVKLRLGPKTFWIPLAHWLEERPEVISLYRIQNNLTDVLSPNLYFFANHPNERVGIKEDEKFPYILLPFFVIGLLGLNWRKNLTALALSVFAPILLYALIGTQIAQEPILMFPFLTLALINGLESALAWISKLKSPNLIKATIGIFIVIYVISLAQTAYYNFS